MTTPPLADSNAISEPNRVFAQHQTIHVWLQEKLLSKSIKWLDLACGQGQILVGLNEVLDPDLRKKIDFTAYDIKWEYLAETCKRASELEIPCNSVQGDLREFGNKTTATYDLITLINTVHEISPFDLPTVLVDCVLKLSDTGVLVIFDMERLETPELGAVTWERSEVEKVITVLLSGLKVKDPKLSVGAWPLKTTRTWDVLVRRDSLSVSCKDADNSRLDAIDQTRAAVQEVLENKFGSCKRALDSYAKETPKTLDEIKDKEHCVYQFWGIWRALGGVL